MAIKLLLLSILQKWKQIEGYYGIGELGNWKKGKKGTCLTSDLFGAALAIGVGLFGDPLAALVGVRERVPWLLVEVRVAPCGTRFLLVVNLCSTTLVVRESLAQPYASSFFPLHLLLLVLSVLFLCISYDLIYTSLLGSL